MSVSGIIWGGVALGGVVVACVSFPRFMKVVGMFFARAVVLSALAFLINFAVKPFGWDIGINLITASVAGALGVPGVAALYVARAILL